MILAGDIGGTKTVLGLFDERGRHGRGHDSEGGHGDFAPVEAGNVALRSVTTGGGLPGRGRPVTG